MQTIKQVIQEANVLQEERKSYWTASKTTSGLILKLKHHSTILGKMNPVDFVKQSKGLVFKIFVITGWQIPEETEMVNVLIDQFQKMLLESYSTFNVDEVEYAMRQFGTKIKDWGKSMNLSLIREALDEYGYIRREISDYEERKNESETLRLNAPEIDDWSEVWAELEKNPNKIIPVSLYDWLMKEKKLILSKEDKIKLFEEAKIKILIESKDRLMAGQDKYREDIKIIESGKLTPEIKTKIANRAKKLAIKNLLNNGQQNSEIEQP